MKTKQEQIEEMTKERNEIKDIMKLLDKCVSLNPMYKSEVASILYGNNYRKLPEDSVVLSREEYEMLKSLIEKNKEPEEIKILLVEDGSIDVDDLAMFIDEHNLKIKIVVYRQGSVPPRFLKQMEE